MIMIIKQFWRDGNIYWYMCVALLIPVSAVGEGGFVWVISKQYNKGFFLSVKFLAN